ncbi:MAG: LamG-like jellyroll fold domain-containing protein, partial [Verrucomicrobiota bacterium]
IYNHATGNRFTFEGWVKGPDQSGNRYFSMGNSSDNTMHYSYLTRAGTAGRGRVFIRDDDFDNLQTSETGLTEFNSQWHHLVWVDNAGTLDHWVDGKQDPTDFNYTNDTITLNVTTFGAIRRMQLSHEINAVLDEFRISDGLRSSNWIYSAWRNVAQYNSFVCPGPVEAVVSSQYPPVVNNGSGADAITADSAIMNATLLTGSLARVTVYWGEQDGGTNRAAWPHEAVVGTFHGPTPVSAPATGLLYGIDYHYRAYASNHLGRAWHNASSNFAVQPTVLFGTPGLNVKVYDTAFGAGNLNPIQNLLAQTPDAAYTFTNSLDFNTYADFSSAYPALTAGSQFSILWDGYLQIDASNTYTFGTRSDDGSVLYIDLNGDGDVNDAGELIVDNNGDHAAQNQTGAVVLVAGCYRL